MPSRSAEDGPVPAIKIATCCYCGTRAALVLKGRERHELCCAACGAPLREMKALPAVPPRDGAPGRYGSGRAAPEAASARRTGNDLRRRKGKTRKGVGRRVFNKVFDLLEDIFD
jgi:hypothetical protein